ncbi:MAG: aldose 1-epimerase family protein [Clostridia bacterium]|nr:aldose 1-epimerase family protein [Clostridia bacterium]
MQYKISNGNLTATISDVGAEVISLQKNGCEYLHDGINYWQGIAPIMFPICGRLFGGKYTYKNNEYEMILHGFVRKEVLSVFDASVDSITFIYKSSDDSKKIYPFDFDFLIKHTIAGDTLTTDFTVINLSDDDLPFALGGHPGFKLPIENKGDFTDCYVEFDEACPAKKIDFTPTCFMTGNDTLFSGEDLKVIPLKHDLFDDDAIFLYDTSKGITLKSNATPTTIRLDFKGFKYIGLWHAPKTDANYVCIEPWTSCPSYDNKIDDFSCKKDMFYIKKGEKFNLGYAITIK